MPESNDLFTRLVELESLITFQEDTVEQLNRTVAEQGDRIARLEMLLRQTREQLELLLPQRSGTAEPEVPPHY